jgi:hypothetical protein
MTKPRDHVRPLQLALGGLWLLDGLLQLQPHMFSDAFVTQVLDPTRPAGWRGSSG